jgi:hypothetical protein
MPHCVVVRYRNVFNFTVVVVVVVVVTASMDWWSEFLATDSEVPGSIHTATRFSQK